MEVVSTTIDVGEQEDGSDYEEYEDEDDDGPLTGSDLTYQSDTPISGVTYNPSRPTRPLTEIERKIQLGGMALEYGVERDKTAKVRFVIGVKERKRTPGKAPEVDRYRRSWSKLKDFMRDHNWRRILSNHFEGDYQDEAIPFEIDGYRWKTVTHFMLGMLYAAVPSYAILFSLNSEDNENAFWGTVKAAVNAHLANINGGPHQPDPDYGNKVENYLQQAVLAKFTQNFIAKEALLLTEDAVISIRGGPDGMLDAPVYAVVRASIKENPTIIYKGPNAATSFTKEEIPYLRSNEQLNHGYVDRAEIGDDEQADDYVDAADLIAGSITRNNVYVSRSLRTVMAEVAKITGSNGYVETETITDCIQIVYLITGTYNFSVSALIERYGQPRFTRRHIYGLEKIADNLQEQLLIGIQRQPCSLMSEYLVFDVELPRTFPIRISIYLEPFEEGFSLFLVTDEKKQDVLDFLRALRGSAIFQEPRGLGEFVEDAQTDLILNIERTKTISPTYEEIYWRLKAVNSFIHFYADQIDEVEFDDQVRAAAKGRFMALFDLVLTKLADFNADDLFNQLTANDAAGTNLEATLKEFREQLKANQVKLDGRAVTDNLLKLIADSKASAVKAGINAPLYQKDLATGKGALVDRDFRFELDNARFQRLTRFFPNEAIASIQITKMLMTHETVTFGSRTGTLMFPSEFYQCLHQIYPLSLDGFSSPLGTLVAPSDVPFASVFDSNDKVFGSLGNVFRLDFGQFITGQVEVNIVLNAPAYQYLINDTITLVDRWFKEATERKVVLRLFAMLPKGAAELSHWIDRHPFLRLKIELKPGEYVQQSSKSMQLVQMNYESDLIVLDNSPVSFRADLFNRCIEALKYKAQ